MELYAARDETKKRNALKRQVAKDRNDLFAPELKEALRGQVAQKCAEALALMQQEGGGGVEATLDALETLFQETRAYYGDEDKSVVTVRTEIAKVFLADENYVDALNELNEIRKPDFVHLKLILECQMKVKHSLLSY